MKNLLYLIKKALIEFIFWIIRHLELVALYFCGAFIFEINVISAKFIFGSLIIAICSGISTTAYFNWVERKKKKATKQVQQGYSIEILQERLAKLDDAYLLHVLNGSVEKDSITAKDNRKKANDLRNSLKILSVTY